MVVKAFINLNPQLPSGFRSSAGIVENDGQNKEREKSLGHNTQWDAEERTRDNQDTTWIFTYALPSGEW